MITFFDKPRIMATVIIRQLTCSRLYFLFSVFLISGLSTGVFAVDPITYSSYLGPTSLVAAIKTTDYITVKENTGGLYFSGGRLGIGATPNSLLVELNAGETDENLLGFTRGSGISSFVFTNEYDGVQGADNKFHILSSQGEAITFTGDGFVGIGTSAPVAPLDVNGDIYVSGNYGFTGAFSGTNSERFLIRPYVATFNITTSYYGIAVSVNSQTTPALNLFKIQSGSPGNVYGNTKTFVIDHPLYKDYYLVHTVLEGPEAAVFYRGKARFQKGVATVSLPDYFQALTKPNSETISITPIQSGERMRVISTDGRRISQNQFQVQSENEDSVVSFYWEVKATRQDIPELQVSAPKRDYVLNGFGPYTYLSKKDPRKGARK